MATLKGFPDRGGMAGGETFAFTGGRSERYQRLTGSTPFWAVRFLFRPSAGR
jgi:hypothetical protein